MKRTNSPQPFILKVAEFAKLPAKNTNRKRLENNKYSQQKDTAYITAGTDKAEQKGKS